MTQHKSVHLNITFRHTESTEALKRYAESKLVPCIQKFAHRDTEVSLVLTVEKDRHIAEAHFNLDGASFAGKEESNDLYASIDLLVNTMSQQLRKHKERLTSHY